MTAEDIREHLENLIGAMTFEYNGKKYLVDNHYVKYRVKTKEIKFADWLSKNTILKIQLNLI